MKKVLIDGDFLCRPLNGIERYAFEITKRLDEISSPHEIAILIPSNPLTIPSYKNIDIIQLKTKIKSHLFWQMVTAQFFLLRHRNYTVLEYGNTCLPLVPSIVFLHDIYCAVFPEDFTSFRDKLVRLYNMYQYRLITRRAERIVTVSEYSRSEISKIFHIPPERIQVIYSSWMHFKTVKPDYSIFADFPALEKPFYFSLGTISKRKNMKWIAGYAAKHPENIFAVSGSHLPTTRTDELNSGSGPKNIILLGYLDDGKIKALMEKCKAFILPSYYEGFGLTPLEALSCGASVIVSNAASLPEIYGGTARYIDPYNTDVDLDALLKEPVEAPDAILEKYSYDKSAREVYRLIADYCNENRSGHRKDMT
ncbi:MAG: glycosyltransferase family 4 protein [Spirochaetaceae bacterium]|jgi:glycosyltransferase involved in cell wall biosynthesis|nr:glycosyltransferase family 4 protein [Spirochaetaceae bacterium]